MRSRFHTQQWLPHPSEVVFAFFANPGNLPRLMPAWQRARLEDVALKPAPHPRDGAPIGSIAAGDDTTLTLSFRPIPLSPFRLQWIARIEHFHWNERFCDVQLRGPFRYWRHCHIVHPAPSHETGEPGTLVEDRIEYELPLSPIGRAGDRLFLRRQIASTFRHRQQRAAELLSEFGTESSPRT
jgi:ligand-binding SRPBCC domain-containing protein